MVASELVGVFVEAEQSGADRLRTDGIVQGGFRGAAEGGEVGPLCDPCCRLRRHSSRRAADIHGLLPPGPLRLAPVAAIGFDLFRRQPGLLY
jgi:hypothetical protein